MKSPNFRRAQFNSGLGVLDRMFQVAKQISMQNKLLRQEKRAKNQSGYSQSGCGPRECTRRMQQMVYDAGNAPRRALIAEMRVVVNASAIPQIMSDVSP